MAVSYLTVDGLQVKVTRKRMKSITLRVKSSEGPIEVSAQNITPDLVIRQFFQAKTPWIQAQRQRLANLPMAKANSATPQEVKEWRAIVEGLTPMLVDHWAKIMGVTPGKLAYRNMTSRWGSCQPSTGRICINVRLALYPPQCLEYVVVHELAHLLVHGHGPKFNAVLDRYLPDWRKRKKLLE